MTQPVRTDCYSFLTAPYVKALKIYRADQAKVPKIIITWSNNKMHINENTDSQKFHDSIISSKSFEQIIEENEDVLRNYKEGVYVRDDICDEKIRKKQSNAAKTYAYEGDGEYCKDNAEDPLVLVDVTVFGKADQGFYITPYELYHKVMFVDRFVVRLKDISTIRHVKDECLIRINGRDLQYTLPKYRQQMEVLVNCIQEYIGQWCTEAEVA